MNGFDLQQLVRDLQDIQVKLDNGFVEEAQEQLEFIIGEVDIAASPLTPPPPSGKMG